MKSFLITYKPATENPERGWPIEELRKLVKRHQAGQEAVEPWRFNNRKDVALGDRVFLLLQGRSGPAIIGYGEIVGKPESSAGGWYAPVKIQNLGVASLGHENVRGLDVTMADAGRVSCVQCIGDLNP